jgi:RNA polymerase sigma-70 factor (ECF subfamily)
VFDLNEKVSSSNNGYNSADLSDIADLTRRIIASLPEKQRLAIHLRDVEGYEMEEIAEVLGMDETNVRMNLSRARKSVREELTKLINYGVKQN